MEAQRLCLVLNGIMHCAVPNLVFWMESPFVRPYPCVNRHNVYSDPRSLLGFPLCLSFIFSSVNLQEWNGGYSHFNLLQIKPNYVGTGIMSGSVDPIILRGSPCETASRGYLMDTGYKSANLPISSPQC